MAWRRLPSCRSRRLGVRSRVHFESRPRSQERPRAIAPTRLTAAVRLRRGRAGPDGGSPPPTCRHRGAGRTSDMPSAVSASPTYPQRIASRWREALGKQTPSSAATQDVEDGVDDLLHLPLAMAAAWWRYTLPKHPTSSANYSALTPKWPLRPVQCLGGRMASSSSSAGQWEKS